MVAVMASWSPSTSATHPPSNGTHASKAEAQSASEKPRPSSTTPRSPTCPTPKRRAYALTGPPPPAWHAHGQWAAPWITPRVLAEGQELAGTSIITPAAVPVPPGQHISPPAETLSAVPPWDTPVATPAVTAETVTDGDEQELVIGIAAAASYLGYDKPDSFRRARTRHPIPGETRVQDGRPAWAPAALKRGARDPAHQVLRANPPEHENGPRSRCKGRRCGGLRTPTGGMR